MSKAANNESTFVFEIAEPPTRTTRGGKAEHLTIAENLKANQGQSALVQTGAKSDGLAVSIRKSTGVAFRDGEYTARSVRREDGLYDIYATYVGPRQ